MEQTRTYTFREICSKIGSGATPTGGKEAYKGGSTALVRSQNVLDFSLTTDGLAYINDEQAKKLNNVKVEKDDVLLNITGDSVARVCLAPDWVIPARVNQHVAVIRGKQDIVLNRYLMYYLQLKKPELLSLSQGGATRNALTKKMIEDIEIVLPTLSSQERVTSILSSLDAKIELNRRINDNLEEQAQALFRSWFVNEQCADSEETTIEEYLTPRRGRNLLTEDAAGGNVPVVAGGLEPSCYHNVANTSAPVITISASGANAGYVNLWDCPVWSADSSFIDASITPHVYFWYNLLKYRQKEIFDAQTGSAQPHIYPQHIASMVIPRLDMEKVERYNNAVVALYHTIENRCNENINLSHTRDTLLPKLMSGELKISQTNR